MRVGGWSMGRNFGGLQSVDGRQLSLLALHPKIGGSCPDWIQGYTSIALVAEVFKFTLSSLHFLLSLWSRFYGMVVFTGVQIW